MVKVIRKAGTLDPLEAIVIDKKILEDIKESPMVLTDTKELNQKLSYHKNKPILKEYAFQEDEMGESKVWSKVWIEEGDIIVKTKNGYIKSNVDLIILDKDLESAIETINKYQE